MRLPRRLAVILVSTVLALTITASCPAAHLVRLTRWEDPAVLVAHHAPGVEYFKLIARAEWPRDAEAGKKYNVHLIYPDGTTETRAIPAGEILSGRLTVLVRTSEVRNRRPAEVVIWVNVSDPATNAVLSNELEATIEDFPRPRPTVSSNDPGPFGWGEPLTGEPGVARRLPRPAPGGFEFVRIPGTDGVPGFFIATTEATNAQAAKGLPGYDPRAGRSDEFTLEDPAQPAVGLNPKQAQDYLAALSKADPSGVTYRLPAQAEWIRAARAGKETAFWWGDESTYPAGANFLGPEPALPIDTTAPARTAESAGANGFVANPWGLFHTFGNVAEWAQAPGAGFVRLGGHFRTEPVTPLPEIPVEDPAATGPDPYVGVRPAFDLDGETGAELIRKALRGNALLAGVSVRYDPDRATATLTGTLPDSSLRRAADRRLEPLWFLAAIENAIETPKQVTGQLATLGPVAGPVRRITPLGRWIYVVPVSVRWADPLPVRGSEWYVNVYPNGDAGCRGHYAYKLASIEPDSTGLVDVLIDRGKMLAAGVPAEAPVAVAISLGAEAPTPTDPRIVSNVARLHWSAP
jgi:Sulfatase-modifying factor enzyme 1